LVLIGSISTQYSNAQIQFALGAISASFVFFFGLGYAARYLQPIFQRPKAWKILDVLIGCVMWSIAVSLVN
jgi:Lysine efflux permease